VGSGELKDREVALLSEGHQTLSKEGETNDDKVSLSFSVISGTKTACGDTEKSLKCTHKLEMPRA